MQPDLDHDRLAHGFRFLLVLEAFCIHPNVNIERERRLAFWLDSSFIIVMTLGIGALAASVVWETPLF